MTPQERLAHVHWWANAQAALLRPSPVYCRQCGIDLFTNPETTVESLQVDLVNLRCDCGAVYLYGLPHLSPDLPLA